MFKKGMSTLGIVMTFIVIAIAAALLIFLAYKAFNQGSGTLDGINSCHNPLPGIKGGVCDCFYPTPNPGASRCPGGSNPRLDDSCPKDVQCSAGDMAGYVVSAAAAQNQYDERIGQLEEQDVSVGPFAEDMKYQYFGYCCVGKAIENLR